MTLAPGTRIGAYEVLSPIGAGGMGEVYRARDAKLNRDVALKILAESFALDSDRVARFKREAQVLALLNHPHIAAIYGFEEGHGTQALVLELVEGPTLADRIAQGPVQLDEALTIATQIVEALEAAQEKGIIHRDLKPANIKVRLDGTVKVLDFGLAKALDSMRVTAEATQSPTLSLGATQAGLILGTAAYMAPEQARGLAADHRSDVFSFGVVLYEMLTGHLPFAGETVADTLASVLARDPDLTALPANLNPRLADLIRRCLDKNPKRRWQAIGDVRVELDTIAAFPIHQSHAQPQARVQWWKVAAAWVVTGAVTSVLTAYATWKLKPAPPASVVRLTVASAKGPPIKSFGRRLAISPDGQQIVYVADRQLFLRHISQSDPVAIRGTENSTALRIDNPTFSPDGQSLAFYSGGTIRKVAVGGGTPTTLYAGNVLGMSWDSTGLVFSDGVGVRRIPTGSGQPELLFSAMQGVVTDAQLLPGGRTLLLTLAKDPAGLNSRIVAQPLPSGEPVTLVEDGTDPRYLPSGQLIFTRGGMVFAGMLDERQMALRSEAVPVLEGIRRGDGSNVGAAQLAVSSSGSLVYLPGPASLSAAQRQLTSIDLQGGRQPLNVPPLGYNSPRISPDSRWLAVDVEDRDAASIYVYPLSGDTQIRRLTLNGRNRFPVWSADSTRVTFQADVAGEAGIFWQQADGTGFAEQLTKSDPGTSHIPEAWSPDGKTLLYAVMRDGIYELYTYSSSDKRSAPFGVRSIYPPGSAVSRDGQWVAYFQRDRGSAPGSLFVQPLSGGAKHEVRNGSGIHPVWVPGGSPLRLIHRLPGSVHLLELNTNPTFGVAKTVELPWGVLFNPGPSSSRNMDFIGNDRIVTVTLPQMDQPASQGDDETIQVVLNWLEELKQRVPMLR